MTRSRFTNAIARATGEDYDVIAYRGFSLVSNECPVSDEDVNALVADWDRIHSEGAISGSAKDLDLTYDECRSIGYPITVTRNPRSRKHRVSTVQGH